MLAADLLRSEWPVVERVAARHCVSTEELIGRSQRAAVRRARRTLYAELIERHTCAAVARALGRTPAAVTNVFAYADKPAYRKCVRDLKLARARAKRAKP